MNLPIIKRIAILALGAESAGVFAIYKNGDIFISENFGDLLDEESFLKYKNAVLVYLKKEKIKPAVILTDLHPLYKTTIFGEELAKKNRITHMNVQHHLAHIFSAVGDRITNDKRQTLNAKCLNFDFNNSTFGVQNSAFFGLAMDGTGYGLDGNIWGGDVFKLRTPNAKRQTMEIERIGSLEEQIMIGGDLAVREPARMLIAILAKLQTLNAKRKINKDYIYQFVKKFYTRNEFEALYNQMEQSFNCQMTTSAGRILDAVAVLLRFTGNERKYKHEAVKLLEKNSTIPYDNLDLRFTIYDLRTVLDTTHLFEYLIKNIHKDKKRLAATAQEYIAKGFYEIVKNNPNTKYQIPNTIFAAGGMTNNKIISEYLEKQDVYLSKKIPRGDEGVAVGQVVYYLFEWNIKK